MKKLRVKTKLLLAANLKPTHVYLAHKIITTDNMAELEQQLRRDAGAGSVKKKPSRAFSSADVNYNEISRIAKK